MTVLDAYALLAFLMAEPAADDVEALLRSATVISAINTAEVLDQLVRVQGRDIDDVHADLATLSQAGVQVMAVTSGLGYEAGRLRAVHYHRDRRPVSLADCVAAATALAVDLPLATSDPDLAAVVRAEGGAVHPLPDSAGRLP